MSTKLDSQLFAQLGGSNWVARAGFFQKEAAVVESSAVPESVQPEENAPIQEVQAPIDQLEQQVMEPVLSESRAPDIENAIVVIGAGLDQVWENEDELSWRLWQNIMFAFGWDESQMAFYDLDHLVSEEMVFTTLEEVIDLNVEWVLTMDASHPVSEQLAEGLQVIEVPDLESMLADPYAKQSFYQSVVELL